MFYELVLGVDQNNRKGYHIFYLKFYNNHFVFYGIIDMDHQHCKIKLQKLNVFVFKQWLFQQVKIAISSKI